MPVAEPFRSLRYADGVNPRALLALAPGALTALTGSTVQASHFLFDGAWFSATLVTFITRYALMRPATAAQARLTPSFRRPR